MSFPFPKIVTKYGKIWKGLNHTVWSNWQKIWEWTCETREKGNKQLHWWHELSLSRCPRNTNMWQPWWRQWDRQWLWHSEMGKQQHRHNCSLASCWGSIACTYCSCMCPHWCRMDEVLVIPQLWGRHWSKERGRLGEKKWSGQKHV